MGKGGNGGGGSGNGGGKHSKDYDPKDEGKMSKRDQDGQRDVNLNDLRDPSE